ncbi:MAG: hypothetical protein KAI73_06910 [Rhodospirillaceae bacterium]|nr:hypothetical protein [Rhodospirillaceae bacterium]
MADIVDRGVDRDDDDDARASFENSPSSLDEMTHEELRMMHNQSSRAILFAKNIQWRTVGSSLLVFGALIALAFYGASDRNLVRLLGMLTIVLAIGAIFVLFMYQFWQFNEIRRLVEIEKNFSSLYIKIRDVKSKREGNVHRYTILMFMCIVVLLGAIVSNIVITGKL